MVSVRTPLELLIELQTLNLGAILQKIPRPNEVRRNKKYPQHPNWWVKEIDAGDGHPAATAGTAKFK